MSVLENTNAYAHMESFNRHASISHLCAHIYMLLDVVTPQMLLISHFFQSLYYCFVARNVTYTHTIFEPNGEGEKDSPSPMYIQSKNRVGASCNNLKYINLQSFSTRYRAYVCVCV